MTSGSMLDDTLTQGEYMYKTTRMYMKWVIRASKGQLGHVRHQEAAWYAYVDVAVIRVATQGEG